MLKIFIFISSVAMIYIGIRILVRHLPGVVSNENIESLKRHLQQLDFFHPYVKKGLRNRLITEAGSIVIEELTRKEKRKVLRKKISQLEALIVTDQKINHFLYPVTSLQKGLISWEEQLSQNDYDFLSLKAEIEKMHQVIKKNKPLFWEIEELFSKARELLEKVKKIVTDKELRDSILELEMTLANYSNAKISFSDIDSFLELRENLQKIIVFLEEASNVGKENNPAFTFKDYYKVLDVSREATSEEIKKAYRKAVSKVHPDKKKAQVNRLDDEELKKEVEGIYNEKFREIQDAYEVLSDPEKRKEYDIKYDEHFKS